MRPRADIEKALLITTAAAVGVCRAIRALTGQQAEIKWVNDIYIDGKKVCGILTEAITDFETGSLESVVTGIGVNFRTPEGGFSEEVQEKRHLLSFRFSGADDYAKRAGCKDRR